MNAVGDSHLGPLVLFHQLYRTPEKVQAHQRRLAALPGDGCLRHLLGFEVLPDVGFQHLVGHAKRAAGVQLFLGEKETVLAAEVANGASRLG